MLCGWGFQTEMWSCPGIGGFLENATLTISIPLLPPRHCSPRATFMMFTGSKSSRVSGEEIGSRQRLGEGPDILMPAAVQCIAVCPN